MTLFIDASVLVAILAEESGFDALADQLDQAPRRLWSPMSCWEAISGLRRSHGYDVEQAREDVTAYARTRRFDLVPVGAAELEIALDAYQTYGRSSGSPARLNMGDCFAYACAKANQARLLYKGDDFIHTDLA
ncbi:type II toxin-antitoxin system VapC family toxin [Sphingomonas cannabina]|uniref:type II toxin-antitoxin system VapC family toxin n=1 Tax=Sphingomonas cannabina TaxID=2899123 RepID=UPI001F1F36B8|nr:type II toxin-antitoxin system VapC family toxin [Sphingomonas cannabina]UIJ45874.1 type II toxin-antitoxin system VapC family toxin [Sphingomonas cannabina]